MRRLSKQQLLRTGVNTNANGGKYRTVAQQKRASAKRDRVLAQKRKDKGLGRRHRRPGLVQRRIDARYARFCGAQRRAQVNNQVTDHGIPLSALV